VHIHVERAAMDDVQAMWAIAEQAGDNPDMRAILMDNVDKRNVYVAKTGFTIVGLATRENTFFGYPYIATLHTDPDYQNHAVAALLIEYLVKTNPADRLFASAAASDETRKYMYSKLGFQRSGMVYHVNPTSESEIIFVRLLT
jgi:ribosomal protein S18 acetylase RimI-like enzyme